MNIVETERLALCELKVEDAPFIFELLNSPGWLQYIGDRGINSLDDAIGYIVNGPQVSYKKNGFGLYLTKLKTDGTPVGICGLIKRDSLPHVDIGFAFLPQYSGKGYAFESAAAIIENARDVQQLDTVVAITSKDNERSIQLLNKIGLTFKSTIQLQGDDEELFLFEVTF